MDDFAQPKGRGATIALLLFATLGVPAGVISFVGGQDWVAQNPGVSLALLIVYEALVILGGLIMEIWTRLRSKWVDRLADWADRWVVTTFSLFRRRYLKWIFYQHRDFDVKGLSTQGTYNLELEQVFVDLTIEPKPVHSTSKDPIQPVPEGLAGRRQIWSYLRSKDFKDSLALIGPPGSGKTTLLKKIALHVASRRRPRLGETIPVLLFLREHVEAIQQNPQFSLAEALRATLIRKEGPVPPEGWLEKKLTAGRCLILFDGLDEVAVIEARQKVVNWVETRMKAHPENRFLVTSRPHGYRDNPISGLTVLEVQSFDRDQIHRFVHNWYRANEIRASGKIDPGVESKAREGAEDLLRRLGKAQTLRDLAVNPLLLTMIATVHRFRSSLPGRRVELYAEICEVFLGKRAQARGLYTELTPLQKQRVLQPLAYYLLHERKREIPVEEAKMIITEPLKRVARSKGQNQEESFLKEIEESSGLLLEREASLYSFAHLVFQEYLAAVHAREQGLGDELIENVSDSWWHEALRLYGAQGDASPILAACLSTPQPTPATLSLAVDCLEESREVDPEWRAKVDALLYLGLEDQDLERFRVAAETLLARRLRDMVPIDEDTWIDPTLVTHAEYQLFLDEDRIGGRYHQPDSWQSFRFPAGQALAPVVGIRYSDVVRFCKWLTERDAVFRFRLPEFEECSIELKDPIQVGSVNGYWSISASGEGLHWFRQGDGTLPEEYFSELRDEDLDFAQAFDHARGLALALESALYLTLNGRKTSRDQARSIISTLRDLIRDLARSLDLSGDLDLDLASELVAEIYRVIIVSFQADSQNPAYEFVRDLALELYNVSIYPFDRAFVQSLAEARERIKGYARRFSHHDAHGLRVALALDVDRLRGFEKARNLGIGIVYLGHHNLNLDRVHGLGQVRAVDPARQRTSRFLRWRARMRALIDQNPRLYCDLAILEARIRGLVSAVEGIRLVKVRRI